MYKPAKNYNTFRACVSFNEQIANALKELVSRGIFSSESEAFRIAVVKMLRDEYPEIFSKYFSEPESVNVTVEVKPETEQKPEEKSAKSTKPKSKSKSKTKSKSKSKKSRKRR